MRGRGANRNLWASSRATVDGQGLAKGTSLDSEQPCLENPRGELPVCAAVNTHTDELDMFHQHEPKSSRLRLSHKCETTSESASDQPWETAGDDSKGTRQSLNGDLYYEDGEWRYVEAFATTTVSTVPTVPLRPEPTGGGARMASMKRLRSPSCDRLSELDRQGELHMAATAEQLGSCMKANAATSCQTYVSMLLQGSPKQKEIAAYALSSMIFTQRSLAREVVAAGAIPVLTSMLRESDAALNEVASHALCSIAREKEFTGSVVAAGATPLLVAIATRHTAAPIQIEAAIDALGGVAQNKDYTKVVVEAGVLAVLGRLLQAASDPVKEAAAYTLSVITQNKAQIDAVVSAQILPVIVTMLVRWIIASRSHVYSADRKDELVTNALGNIARSGAHTAAVVEAGAVPVLVSMLQGGEGGLQKAAADTLSIISQSHRHTSVVVAAGAVPVLVSILQAGNEDLRQIATDAISNIVQNQEHIGAVVAAGVLPVLVSHLQSCHDGLKELATIATKSIARNHTYSSAVVDAGAVPVLVSLLKGPNEELSEVAADALKEIAHNELHTDAVVSAGAVPALLTILQAGNTELRLVATESLRSIANNSACLGAVCQAGAFETLLSIMQNDADEDMRNAASDVLQSMAEKQVGDTDAEADAYSDSDSAGYESSSSDSSDTHDYRPM